MLMPIDPDARMIRGVHHTAIGVRDMERSLAFYRDLLGLPVLRDWIEDDRQIDLIVGLPDARLRIVHLDAGAGGVVELIEYLSPRGKPLPPDFQQCDFAVTHLAFRVRGIQALYERLRAAGVRFTCPPQERPNGWYATYFFDPNDVTLELLEEPAA